MAGPECSQPLPRGGEAALVSKVDSGAIPKGNSHLTKVKQEKGATICGRRAECEDDFRFTSLIAL